MVRLSPPRLAAAGIAVVLVLPLGGCGGPAMLSSEDLEPDAARSCRALVEALPSTLADQPRVPSEGAPGAAYEDGLTVRCGVTAPGGVNRFSTCQSVNGIDWYVPEEAIEDADLDVVATTLSRTPRVQLTVPGDLRPPAAALAQLTQPVEAGTRRDGPACR